MTVQYTHLSAVALYGKRKQVNSDTNGFNFRVDLARDSLNFRKLRDIYDLLMGCDLGGFSGRVKVVGLGGTGRCGRGRGGTGSWWNGSWLNGVVVERGVVEQGRGETGRG